MSAYYFIKNPKSKLFWDGSYPSSIFGTAWKTRPRFFKSLPALLASLNLSLLPRETLNAFRQQAYDSGKCLGSERLIGNEIKQTQDYYKVNAFVKKLIQQHCKKHNISALTRLQDYCKSNGFVLYELESGKAIRNAKSL